LCRLLLSQPDILLLDEPTNHLDIDSRTWLETFLTSYKGLVISITHDRYFLDNVAQYILEVEAGRLHPFTGNYGAWIRHKEQRLIAEQKKDKNMEKIIAQELAWSKKNPKGQQAKSKAMLNSLEKKTVQRDVLSIARRIESGSLVIPEGPRLGDNVVEIKNLSYQINNRVVFENLSFSLSPGKVVGILGPNGSGKTTLLKCITQCHAPTSGTIKVGGSVRIGYNAQTRDTLNDKKTVWEEVCGGRDEIEVTKGTTIPARNYVAQFNFKGADQQKRIGELSGGERNRVSLAKSLAQGCNLIILDEPTNDLDINTMQKLEEALKEFNGAAIVVTHDRKFLESLADELIIFQEEGGKVMYYPGTYEEWRKSRNGDSEALKSRKHRKFASA
jgi:ATPase subunit of ABC transporter with duplicated ATPase domains